MLLLVTILIATRFPAAFGQIDPDDTGEGAKLGLAQQSGSGQVGTVSIFERGRRRALVVLALFSVPPGLAEPAAIGRARSCERPVPAGRPVLRLKPVFAGASRSIIPWPRARLLSGNYVIEVFAAKGSRRVTCGELHR